MADRQLSAANDRFEAGQITRTDVAFSESELHNATTKRVFTELALSNNNLNNGSNIPNIFIVCPSECFFF